MPSTVLGKRGRDIAEEQTILTRSKRRIVLNEPNDENENPFLHHERKANEEHGEGGKEHGRVQKAGTHASTVPAKHGAPGRRVKLSPSNIQSHFKTGKSTVAIFEDGKSEPGQTPKTPRHRDALTQKVAVTPRHRALLAGSPLTPRTPKTPARASDSSTSVYNLGRQLFTRCSQPESLFGREDEKSELSAFVDTCRSSDSAGCLYVSGPPGTGKSAFVEQVTQKYRNLENVITSVTNCMSVRTTKDLLEKLAQDLECYGGSGFEHLRSCFLSDNAQNHYKYLVILDEIDRLVDINLDLLYSLFELALRPRSRLILIGIANALDLTDRVLPRLKSRNLQPELLPFMPYSAAQISEILTAKLRSLSNDETSATPLLHPASIQFCAKKVASQTGDLRKAFDICRQAIDLVEQETREKDERQASQESPSRTPLMENINLSSSPTARSPSHKSAPAYTLETIPKVTIAHMAKITAQAFGNGISQRLATLNLQQKAVLCALTALERKLRSSQIARTVFATPSKHNNSSPTAPSIKLLFETYTTLCKRENLLHPLTSLEFRDVVSGLETLSLISPAEGRKGSFVVPLTPSRTPSRKGKGGFGTGAAAGLGDERRVAGVVGEKELAAALVGPGGALLREMLDGDGVV